MTSGGLINLQQPVMTEAKALQRVTDSECVCVCVIQKYPETRCVLYLQYSTFRGAVVLQYMHTLCGTLK